MNIVISHKRVKRSIEGTGFNICASKADLKTIHRALAKVIEDPSFHFGWINIRDELPDDHCSGVNTHPLKWDAGKSGKEVAK